MSKLPNDRARQAALDDRLIARSVAAPEARREGFDLEGFLALHRAADGNGVAASADVAVARAAETSGSALPGDVRDRFESSLGADLSSVRVHTGSESAQAAQAVGARAYATGQDIHFADGQYQPASADGLHLLAHEVAHTVQQAGGATTERQHKLEVSSPGDALEVEADRVADAIVSGATASVSSAAAGGVHRDPTPAKEDPKVTEVKTKVAALCAAKFKGDYKAGFDHYDADHDGQCTKDEVIALLKDAKVEIVATWGMIANGVIEAMDGNKDGKISFAEFNAVMSGG
jgi:hypothetical protein